MYRATIGVDTDDSVFTAQIDRVVLEHKMFAVIKENVATADIFVTNGYSRRPGTAPMFALVRPGVVEPEWVGKRSNITVMKVGDFTESDLALALSKEIEKIAIEKNEADEVLLLTARAADAEASAESMASEQAQVKRYQKLLVEQTKGALSTAGFDCAAYYKPYATASGDVLLAVPYGDSVYVMLADATNHGTMAALTASMLRVTAKMYFQTTPVQKVNIRGWAEHIVESFSSYSTGNTIFDIGKMSSTVTLVSLSKRARRAEFVFFGTADISPVIVRGGAAVPLLAGVDLPKILPPLGDFELDNSMSVRELTVVEDFVINSVLAEFLPGDALVLYSDGLSDVKKDCDDFMGQSERYLNDKLAPVLTRAASSGADAEGLVQALVRDAAAFSTTQLLSEESVVPESTDDVTILSIVWSAKETEGGYEEQNLGV